jgi:hypothetical protein
MHFGFPSHCIRPMGVFQTVLLASPPEKKTGNLAFSNGQDIFSGPFCRRQSRNCAHFSEFPEQPRLHAGVTERYIGKVFGCAFLAPDIVEAILEGRQPRDLSFKKLCNDIPLSWTEQRKQFGFSR